MILSSPFRNSEHRSLELAWTVHDPETDTERDLARYGGGTEGFLAGNGPGVAASWEMKRWSLHLSNVSKEDSGYYECQVSDDVFVRSSLICGIEMSSL